jgi:hypothetical protein
MQAKPKSGKKKTEEESGNSSRKISFRGKKEQRRK